MGWIIVNYQNNLREQRKERRAAADMAKASCERLCAMAIEYYTKADFPLSVELLSRCEELDIELKRVDPFFSNESNPLWIAFSNLYDSITLDPFENREFEPFDRDSDLCYEILRSKTSLIREIESAFKRSNEYSRNKVLRAQQLGRATWQKLTRCCRNGFLMLSKFGRPVCQWSKCRWCNKSSTAMKSDEVK